MSSSKIANHIRRIAEAIAQGRIDARLVSGMTDDQIDAYLIQLDDDLDAAIAEGESKSAEPSE
jgi:hypothetical protein